jgi:hypothetical protein
MKVCFYAPKTKLTESLRRCVRDALGVVTDLSETPSSIWKEAVASADLVVVDATAETWAAYLAGLADALGKRVVLLSPIDECIPPVLADRGAIIHHWNLEILRGELRKFCDAPSDEAPPIADDTPAGKFRQMFGDLLRTHGYVHRGSVEFDGSTFTLREQEMELALVQAIAHRAKSLNVRVRLL